MVSLDAQLSPAAIKRKTERDGKLKIDAKKRKWP
jgi:hypothetical protein